MYQEGNRGVTSRGSHHTDLNALYLSLYTVFSIIKSMIAS